ncbi:MAG: diphosphate--fructose-6-phosphate 1-phosphotransferase [Candidatus Latescibacterota bacterium]
MSRGKLGILVGGGPAPGINGVIGAAAIKAIEEGLQVVGIYDGFKWLCRGDASQVTRLTVRDVSRIHFQGGSILRTARDNPTRSEELMDKAVSAIRELGLSYLVTIGGDDTAFSAASLARRMSDSLRVAHVPKTIDNDLPLPGNMPTFGFQTARHLGVQLVQNLMEDARTTSRWYVIVAMGRKAGHLALGIGKAAGATLVLIAEDFPNGKLTLDRVGSVIEGAIIKRRTRGRADGVAIVAEGIAERLDPEELCTIPGVEVIRDDHGNLELREVPLARVLKRQVEKAFAERGDRITLVHVDLGYELRCAPPIPFDAEYVRDLGWGAVSYLLGDSYNGGALICLDPGGHLTPLHFEQLMDPQTGRTRVRMVDTASESFKVAREYMIRLMPKDLADPAQVGKLAKAAMMTPDAFRARFGGVV